MANNTYRKRIEQGLCAYCGKYPSRPNKTSCQTCYEKQKQTQKKLREKKKALGICTMCNRPSFEEQTLCQYHLEKIKERAIERRKERNKIGICQECGKYPMLEGHTICNNCMIKKHGNIEWVDVYDHQSKKVIKLNSIHNIKGKKFNNITVLEYSYKQNNSHYWLCQCDCGNIVIVNHFPLTTLFKKNCGECGG